MSGRWLVSAAFLIGVGVNAAPAWGTDAIMFVNRVNNDAGDGAKTLSAQVVIDGNPVTKPNSCEAEPGLRTLCDGEVPATVGDHTIEVQIEGEKRVTKKLTFADKDAASGWELVPKDTRLWCVAVERHDFHQLSKKECWKLEDDE